MQHNWDSKIVHNRIVKMLRYGIEYSTSCYTCRSTRCTYTCKCACTYTGGPSKL